MNTLENMNRELFLQINAGTDTPSWLIYIATLIAEGFIYIIPLLLVVLWLWGDSTKRKSAIKICVLALVALGINQLIGLMWQHPRPSIIGLGNTWISHAPDSSFPSDHVTVFAATSLVLLFNNMKKIGFSILLVGFFVAWARIYLGVHFPLDMLGALLVTMIAYAIVEPFWRYFGEAATDSIERLYRIIFRWPISKGWTLK